MGFKDPGLTIEKIAAHWPEIMEPSGSRIVNSGEVDPAKWNVKPCRGPPG
jgi:hypothetical protein